MTPNLFRQIAALEAKTGKPYPLQVVAAKAGVHRHTIETLVAGKAQGIHFSTLGALVDFFASEGMPLDLNDLFHLEQS